jgi:hypothetical protein
MKITSMLFGNLPVWRKAFALGWTICFILPCFVHGQVELEPEATVANPSRTGGWPSVDELLNGFYRENGGRLTFEKLRSYRIIGEIRSQGNTSPLWVFRKYPNRFRIAKSGSNGRDVYGYDGNTFWRGFEQEGRLTHVERVDSFHPIELAFEADFQGPMLALRRLTPDLMVVGAEALNGRQAYIVEGNTAEGITVRVWVDAIHFQAVLLSFTINDKAYRIEYSDYRKVGDYWFAHSLKNIAADGTPITHVITKEVTFNPGLFDWFFSPALLSSN